MWKAEKRVLIEVLRSFRIKITWKVEQDVEKLFWASEFVIVEKKILRFFKEKKFKLNGKVTVEIIHDSLRNF